MLGFLNYKKTCKFHLGLIYSCLKLNLGLSLTFVHHVAIATMNTAVSCNITAIILSK